ncbi:hypothetical protein [Azospirillum sp. TSO35-2]|uniref:hypothetical protein n=1 Tax=Azospirillum sp. TSO35-2 TaxID=716796 RepID=UPI000D61342C|nr:hypothetical protein [Azospirillum sp. TSO35-2]PWC33847.1 hypothetical protein TSO352_26095 [Azospirillum sp. TSO35-2]
MSYLTGPRLTFTGKFIADVSTVNNHAYAFQDDKRYTADDYASWHIGYWNPYGTGVWRLTDCVVTGAVNADGSTAAGDPVIGLTVADANDRPPAKMVDLDTEQQMVSAIWGLLVRLAGKDGADLLRGEFDVASFTDLWWRNWAAGPVFEHPPHPPAYFGASFQSVLRDLSWGDVGASPFLTAFKAAAADGLLSIKFNVTGYNAGYGVNPPDNTRYLPNPPGFTTGLMTGTIGIAARDEPRFYTPGRQLQPTSSNLMAPGNRFGYATAVVDEQRSLLTIDLGNSIPFKTWRGEMVDEPLHIGYFGGSDDFNRLAEITPDNAWYETTAGICTIPLTDAQRAAIGSSPLTVYSPTLKAVLGSESPDGRAVCADQFVFRMSPGDSATTTLWATRFGKPLANTAIAVAFDSTGLQPSNGVPVGEPESALSFDDTVTTDARGVATLTMKAQDPGTPRTVTRKDGEIVIDGQIYGIRPSFPDATPLSYQNAYDFISVLVWSGYAVPEQPTWEQDIKPILVEYANLYPVMLPVLDMGNYDSVCKHLYALQTAMALPVEDPNYMPVVRDLSPAKSDAVLKWATNPIRGVVPPPKPTPVADPSAVAAEALSWAAAPSAGSPILRK